MSKLHFGFVILACLLVYEVYGVKQCYEADGSEVKVDKMENCTNVDLCFTEMNYVNGSSTATTVKRGCLNKNEVCNNNCTMMMKGNDNMKMCKKCCDTELCNDQMSLYDDGVSSATGLTISLATVFCYAVITQFLQ